MFYRTDAMPEDRDTFLMQNPSPPRILEAERLDDGVIITYADGVCAVYPTSLLHANLSQARLVTCSLNDSEEMQP